MPIMKSAKKRLRQNIKHNLRNRSFKTALKTQMKKFLSAVKEGNSKTAEEELRLTVKKLDKGRTKGMLHKNTVSRKKSRLAKKLSQVKASTPKS